MARRPVGDRMGGAGSGRPLRVAMYIRISTDEEHQPFSLEAQEVKLRSYIDSQPGWELVGAPYRDEASGATTDRPGLQRALTAARAGYFDVLLVYRVDRLSRSLRGLVEILDQLDETNTIFRSATEPFDTATPVGRMLVQMLGVFAQFERETIIDRVINGMERKAARGEWCGGYRPYGYELDPATGKLAVVEREAPLIPVIFDLYVNARMGTRALAKELNTRGHRTKSGKRWSGASVMVVLRNRAYLGEVYFRGHWHKGEDPHPSLIDPELFEQAQQIIAARGDDYSRRASNSSDYLLAGRVKCTVCEKNYIGTSASGNKYRYRYYTCFTLSRYGKGHCEADRLPADQLEDAVLEALLAVYADADLIAQAVHATAERRADGQDLVKDELEAVNKEIAAAEAGIDRYLTAFETGDLPQSVCGPRVQALAEKAAQLRDRQRDLQDSLDPSGPTAPSEEDLAALRAGIREAIDSGVPAVVKSLLEVLVHEVRVESRTSIKPVFRLPEPARSPDPDPGSGFRAMLGSVPPAGLEPAAKCLEGTCSIH
jgi:site-specific DNA recombinase